ncbi:MAG: A/G-specific adenine glycosylase [Anaerolineales bacterium]
MKQSSLSSRIITWYRENARRLPWRDHPDPYAVWVSEIMLQQTRVETVIPYFQRWMARFPTIQALAEASQQEVLASWEGLGYYSRARNLHNAAKVVVGEYAGRIPQDPAELRRLPGIGRYTAAAIASIAFEKDEAALDGNIRRVLARVFDVREPSRSPAGEKRLWELAASHLPPGQAGDYNQALMDLGSTVCTPKSPDCPNCPLQELCQAKALGVQEQRPVRVRKPPIPHHTVTAAVIEHGQEILIAQRPPEGLLGGLWEFPGGKARPGEDLIDCLKREICEELDTDIQVGDKLGVYQHAYTHFRVTLHAYRCWLLDEKLPRPLEVQDLRWVRREELPDFPMGKIDRQIATSLMQL